ncbi:RHS repeat-associated core domain-containing protein [Pseudomonas migulae]|uniref:Insecticidal toxin complex protein TccC n=1 Tax=Pseudomonas migulae TaxID=78543 RepID=A0A1H5FX54_9PSED|nr:RHS repeat-associated core domain-containing protein [Pseudomonas migulae]SEE07754.1 insecticidal toxin complex protein TccC [Pseudomonas migulae]
MDIHATALHSDTPNLIAIESRGLVSRSVDYDRADAGDTAQPRVNRIAYDPAGRAIAQWDPRLFLNASAPANLSTIHSLSGAVLSTISVDAGLHVSLFGEAGQPIHSWDGRGSQRWMLYDDQLRLTALFERAVQGEALCAERLTYAANDQAFVDHNQCGRLICHEDPAGAVLFNDYGLTGAILEQERRFAKEPPPGFVTHSRFNPQGDLLSRTDAQGNEQCFRQTVGGQLSAVDLRLNNTLEWLPMVSAITCNAHGQVEREVAGNGVITILKYTAEDGRLQRLVSRLGQNEPLQDLRYAYDPVGNVLSIEDAALPIRYFANQRIEPVSHYWYDTLYRLIEATGWEAGSVNHGPSSAMTADPAMPGNYRQTYRYDAGNNLLELTHFGPQNHGHRLVAEAHSNRCLPVRDGIEPGEDDFRNGFDANGNLLSLQPGQTLSWDLRNQLREVRPVKRDVGHDDCECYDYGADGMRVRKVRSLQTNAQTVVIETRYLPGVEIRTHSGTGEVLHVIDVTTGRGSVRVLHWEAEKPNEITNNQQRYSLTDHLGSSTLELDQDASLITPERYYPFGGTAWSNGMAVQISYKTVRYSGKEQDATGLYYYGLRYYISWVQRWLNPDPLGAIDGLNVYAMTLNNPVSFVDRSGTDSEVPRQINWIWLGAPLPLDAAMNINHNLAMAAGYSATLWVDTQAGSKHAVALEHVDQRVRIANVSDLFQGQSQKLHEAFERERSGPLKNYAAASDIARLLVKGVYLDVDVRLKKSLPTSLNAPAGLLLHTDENGNFSNAILAAGKDSHVLARARSKIADEYSKPASVTWMKKRAYPGPAEVALQKETKAAYLQGMRSEMLAMAPAIKAASTSERSFLLTLLNERRADYEDAKGASPEVFSRSSRVDETVRITGPGVVFYSLDNPDPDTFGSGQFEPVDGSGNSIFSRPSELRRASF